jgi:hypothetical protein
MAVSALMHIEHALELDDQRPLLLRHIAPVELLQSIDTRSRDVGVEDVLLLQLATVTRLVGSINLDCDTGLTLLTDGDLLVISLDRRSRIGN